MSALGAICVPFWGRVGSVRATLHPIMKNDIVNFDSNGLLWINDDEFRQTKANKTNDTHTSDLQPKKYNNYATTLSEKTEK